MLKDWAFLSMEFFLSFFDMSIEFFHNQGSKLKVIIVLIFSSLCNPIENHTKVFPVEKEAVSKPLTKSNG